MHAMQVREAAGVEESMNPVQAAIAVAVNSVKVVEALTAAREAAKEQLARSSLLGDASLSGARETYFKRAALLTVLAAEQSGEARTATIRDARAT